MVVDINSVDLNDDYFHFTNKKNLDNILNEGLIPQVGVASALVDDRPNVSISKGAKGIMGIIDSFLYKFKDEIKVSEIPEPYRIYFTEITDFNQDKAISKNIAYNAMKRKLSDEVYLRVRPTKEQLENARVGGMTGYDVNLENKIASSQLDVVTDSNNKVLSALDVAKHVYNKAKDIEVFRDMHSNFFDMFEFDQEKDQEEHNR